MAKLSEKKRQELIDHLIGNCGCDDESKFEESDIETLNKFEDDVLLSMVENSDEEEIEEPLEADSDDNDEEEESVENSKFDESDLPQEVLEDLQFARNMRKQQKDQLIAKIVSNKSGLFTKKELEAKSVDELTKISSYVANEEKPKKKPNRIGTVVDNKAEPSANDILETPVINW